MLADTQEEFEHPPSRVIPEDLSTWFCSPLASVYWFEISLYIAEFARSKGLWQRTRFFSFFLCSKFAWHFAETRLLWTTMKLHMHDFIFSIILMLHWLVIERTVPLLKAVLALCGLSGQLWSPTRSVSSFKAPSFTRQQLCHWNWIFTPTAPPQLFGVCAIMPCAMCFSMEAGAIRHSWCCSVLCRDCSCY